MRMLMKTVCAAAAALAAAVAPAAEETKAEAPAETEAKPAAPKKLPKKLPVYNQMAAAEAVAKAWEQPILIVIECDGEKACSKLRSTIYGNRTVQKELFEKNCVFYQIKVPLAKERRNNNRGGNNNNKPREKPMYPSHPGKPDFNEVRPKSEAEVAYALAKKGNYPVILLRTSPSTKDIPIVVDADSATPLGSFVTQLKEAMTASKGAFEVSPKIQKLIDTEAKKAEAQAKRAKK